MGLITEAQREENHYFDLFRDPCNNFALELTSHLPIFSPMPIFMIVVLWCSGSNTPKPEICQSLFGLNNPTMEDLEKFIDLLLKFSKQKDPVISSTIENRLYLPSGLEMGKNYKNFLAHLQFTVVNQTSAKENQIENSAGSVDLNSGSAPLLFASDLNLKLFWDKKFQKNVTKMADFFTSKNEAVKVEMMKQQGEFACYLAPDETFKVLKMWFGDFDGFMLIVLPEPGTSLQKLRENFDTTMLKKILNEMRMFNVEVSLPKFIISHQFDHVTESLSEIFHTNFTFEVESSNETLFLSPKVVQKIVIEVNEDGKEEGAPSNKSFDECGTGRKVELEEIKFEANRRFLVLILDDKNFVRHVGEFSRPSSNAPRTYINSF